VMVADETLILKILLMGWMLFEVNPIDCNVGWGLDYYQ
jgi:hypothetical protein